MLSGKIARETKNQRLNGAKYLFAAVSRCLTCIEYSLKKAAPARFPLRAPYTVRSNYNAVYRAPMIQSNAQTNQIEDLDGQ